MKNGSSHDQKIASLPFGFWAGMLGSRHENIWRVALRHAFPGGNGSRKEASKIVEGVRKFRNRVAHHDSVLNLDIPFEVANIHHLARLLGSDRASWLRTTDRTPAVYAERHVRRLDTVVVAAHNAWPLYQELCVYLCPPTRYFPAANHIAFYADSETKREIPRILHRRDNVSWTDKHTADLSLSSDSNDRQISQIIRASRNKGWTQGIYQVFLLTKPGDEDKGHLTLPHPIPHQLSGRGTAFTQRQRSVSLHELKTATTTLDLGSSP